MNRTAILANANSGNAGAQRNLEHWHSFLVSPLGGAWLDKKEVHVLSNPSKADMQTQLRSAAADGYVIVVFLGHGEFRKDLLGFPEVFLSLHGSDAISERELNPRSDRCSIIVDLGQNESTIKSIAMQPTDFDEIRLSRARELFDSEVTRAEKGCVKVYAANLNRETQHNHSFSATLIEQSIEWAQRHHGTLDLHQAISQTTEIFERKTLLQGPRYQGGRRLHHFPFAVKPKD